MAPCVRKVCFCVTDTLFTWAVLLIQCLFDSRSAPLSKFILTLRLLHASKNFPVFYHSTSLILSACGCCMGKGSYRNTKHKYVFHGLGADTWFSLWFLSVCFVFYVTLSKNDHAGPTCWPDQTKPQNPVLFHMELCCGPCYVLEQWMGLPGFSVDQENTQIYFKRSRE